MVPSIEPPSISAVVTVPRLAIVVLAKVEFLPTMICSLSSVVTNLRYELPPWLILSASAKLSVKLILFLVVSPPNCISSPVVAVSIVILSQLIDPTFVMLPSDTFKAPHWKLVGVTVVISPAVVPFSDPILATLKVSSDSSNIRPILLPFLTNTIPKSFELVVFPSPTTISGSSIVKVVEFTVVVVPITVKSPATVTVDLTASAPPAIVNTVSTPPFSVHATPNVIWPDSEPDAIAVDLTWIWPNACELVPLSSP